MMGKKESDDSKLYYYGFSLSERIPKDHPLRTIKKALKICKQSFRKPRNFAVRYAHT